MNHVTFTLTARENTVIRINLAWPQGLPPQEGWPVSYVLDEKEFWIALGRTRSPDGSPDVPGDAPGVVVGVGVEQREQRQYIYTPVINSAIANTQQPEGSGGFQVLAEVLAEQVMPWVQHNLSINAAQQSLCGHSLAGLFVCHYLLTVSSDFSRYVISSPSVWWGDFYLLQCAAEVVSQPRPKSFAEVYISVGQFEQGLGPRDHALSAERQALNLERRQARRMVDGAKELADLLGAYPGLDLHFQVIPSADHGTASASAWEQLFA